MEKTGIPLAWAGKETLMRITTLINGKNTILYDADLLDDHLGSRQIQPAFFTPQYWRERDRVTGEAPGRGSSLFIRPDLDTSTEWVLRPYRRGGLIAHFSQTRYVWTGQERTRAVREVSLNAALFEQGLPVARPVGACIFRHGLTYEAAFMTQRIPGARALAEYVRDPRLSSRHLDAVLTQVGHMIRDFHHKGLDHVDLNARNILVDLHDNPWLIDLDRCRLRSPGSWQHRNMNRIQASLRQFAPSLSMVPVLRGYRAAP